MATQMMAGEMFEFKWSRIKTFIAMIVGTTFTMELLAAIYFYFPFRKILPAKKAAFYALFHSVSAFCNTGITLLDNGLSPFKQNTPFLLTTAFLVFVGSIGFVVWFEVASKIKNSKFCFSIHTKIVLVTTAFVILFGTLLTWFLERNNTLANLSFSQGMFASFFNTVSLRSAGFDFFSVESIAPATILLFLILMYIGGSPGSIAGGIKTTTFALFIATMATIVRNRDEVELFGRRIPQNQIFRAISIIVLSSSWVFLTTFFLLIFEKGFNFIQVFFEVVSALSLCGLPTSASASFSIFGKLLIILTMLLGRIGSLTLVFALWSEKKKRMYRYPEERIVIG
jgi:trk system potassium uptake protein TrkH